MSMRVVAFVEKLVKYKIVEKADLLKKWHNLLVSILNWFERLVVAID